MLDPPDTRVLVGPADMQNAINLDTYDAAADLELTSVLEEAEAAVASSSAVGPGVGASASATCRDSDTGQLPCMSTTKTPSHALVEVTPLSADSAANVTAAAASLRPPSNSLIEPASKKTMAKKKVSHEAADTFSENTRRMRAEVAKINQEASEIRKRTSDSVERYVALSKTISHSILTLNLPPRGW